MDRVLLLAVVVVVGLVAAIGGSGGQTSATTTGAPATSVGGMALAQPTAQPTARQQEYRTSFGQFELDQTIAAIRSRSDAGAQIVPAGCVPYQQGGVAVPGQFTDCRIDAYWSGKFAGSFRLYVAGGQLVLVGL